MPSTTATFTARDGTELLVRAWASAEPSANVLLVHGIGEHSGRYEHVGEHLAAAGIATDGYDHRGFGGSGGPRGHVDRWEQLHEDLEERLGALRTRGDPGPTVVYGHSTGALVALGHVLSGRPAPDLLILSAPAVDADLPAWRKAVARILGRVLPRASIANGIDPARVSRDPDVVMRYRTDPLNHDRVTLRLGMLGIAEQPRIRVALTGLELPTLVLHGGADRLVPTIASEPFAALPNVSRIVYPGLAHEIHNEPEWTTVIDDVIHWIHDRAGGPSVPLRG